jgi:pyruvate kinase
MSPLSARPVAHASRAKIVCTLGPPTSSLEALNALVEAGMDVARLNFSHGTHADHGAMIAAVRVASATAGRPIAVLADLQGPKIRLGMFPAGPVAIETGAEFTITTEPVEGSASIASTSYADLARDVAPGDPILIDDGLIRLEVLATDGVRVRCRVVEGGTLSNQKGINLPGVKVSAPALTDKDREDLVFALAANVDAVALSFVRSPGDAVVVRAAMERAGRRVPLFAKIEKPEAVERLDAIIEGFDGLMVARGDLGVEMALEQVPLVQKRAVRLARAHAKPVIVATQMLDSMINHSRPTRAEASDVANAVLDGADALMLSGETSAGRFPVEAVRTMRRLIAATEQALPCEVAPERHGEVEVSPTVARAAVETAIAVGAKALVAYTRSGATARQIASHRAPIPLLAFTSDPDVVRQLPLVWGVRPQVMLDVRTSDYMIEQVDKAVREAGVAGWGDLVVVVSGVPSGESGSTNQMRVHRVSKG